MPILELSGSGEDRQLLISVSFEKAKVCSQSRKIKKANRGLKARFFGIRFIETYQEKLEEEEPSGTSEISKRKKETQSSERVENWKLQVYERGNLRKTSEV